MRCSPADQPPPGPPLGKCHRHCMLSQPRDPSLACRRVWKDINVLSPILECGVLVEGCQKAISSDIRVPSSQLAALPRTSQLAARSSQPHLAACGDHACSLCISSKIPQDSPSVRFARRIFVFPLQFTGGGEAQSPPERDRFACACTSADPDTLGPCGGGGGVMLSSTSWSVRSS